MDRPELIDTGRGLTIRYRGKLLYSGYDPRASASKRAARVQLAPNTLIFVPSLGLGYGLKELLSRLPDDCYIFCVEADQMLMALALEHKPELPQDPRLFIVRTEDTDQILDMARRLGLWRFRRLKILPLCAGYHTHRHIYNIMERGLEEEIRRYWQNKMTLIGMARLWAGNLFKNLKTLPAAQDLERIKVTQPVLVTGAGPSLEHDLLWIKANRDKFLLITVDTALPVLMDVRIRPDFIFMLESQVLNLDDFLPYHDPEIPLICDLTSNPRIIRLFDTVYFFSSRFYPLALFDRLQAFDLLPTPFPPLGSVGVAAVQAALEMSSGPVITAGLDFSYPTGKTHARGAPVNRRAHFTSGRFCPPGLQSFSAILDRPLLKLPDKSGQYVQSDLVLHSYAILLQKKIGGKKRVYTLSASGLPTGARPLYTEQERRVLFENLRRHRKSRQKQHTGRERVFAPTCTKLTSFFDSEQKLLGAAEEQIQSYLSEMYSEKETSLREIVKEVEYALLHFPDLTPRLDLNRNLITRALAAVRYYRSRISVYRS